MESGEHVLLAKTKSKKSQEAISECVCCVVAIHSPLLAKRKHRTRAYLEGENHFLLIFNEDGQIIKRLERLDALVDYERLDLVALEEHSSFVSAVVQRPYLDPKTADQQQRFWTDFE